MADLVTNVIKFNAQTNGRDKLCRLFQYSCRLAWGTLEKQDKKDVLATLKNIESMLSMTRKLLRFGKSLDFIQGALKSIHIKDPVLRLTLTLAKVNQAFYLLFDHFLWFNNVGAVKLDKQFWGEVSARFYLATLLLNLVRDFYEVYLIVEKEQKVYKSRTSRSEYKNGDAGHRDVGRRQSTAVELLVDNKTVWIDLFKNLFDLAIPLSTLKFLTLSPSKQGSLGIISSFLAIVSIWNPTLKLLPA